MVAGGVGAHGRFAHWAGISCIHVICMSHELLSFTIIVLFVFCLQFSVFSYLFTMVSLVSITLSLFDLIFHTYSETFLIVNDNIYFYTLQR